MREDGERLGDLLEVPAAGEDGHAVGEADGLVDVVGDEQDGGAHLGEDLRELGLEVPAELGVDGAEGLVEQEDGRVGGERAGHADALALSTGELVREAAAVGPHGQADQLEHLFHAASGAGTVPAEELRHRRDVGLDRPVRQQADVLDDVPDPAAELHRVEGRGVDVVEQDAAARGFDEAVDHAQGGGLAAAGRADQREHLPRFRDEAERLDGDGAAARTGVCLGDGVELDTR